MYFSPLNYTNPSQTKLGGNDQLVLTNIAIDIRNDIVTDILTDIIIDITKLDTEITRLNDLSNELDSIKKRSKFSKDLKYNFEKEKN